MATKSWQTGPKGGKFYVDAHGEKKYGDDALKSARQDMQHSKLQAVKAGGAKANAARVDTMSKLAQAKAMPKVAQLEPNPRVEAEKATAHKLSKIGDDLYEQHLSGEKSAEQINKEHALHKERLIKEHIDKQSKTSPAEAHEKPIPKPREWVDKLEHLPDPAKGGTMSVHFPGSTFKPNGEPLTLGKPTPERKALHDRVKAEAFAAAPKSLEKRADGKPVAIITMGGPGSGKSAILKGMGIDDSRFVKIDSDHVKTQLPEYREATRMDGSVGPTAKNAARVAHEESSHVAKKIRDEAMAGGHNLIFDGTGNSIDSYHGMIKKLKEKGYHVNVIMSDVDADVGIARAKGRAEKTGRDVPEDFARAAYKRIPANFEPIAHEAHDFALYNNHGKKPSPVYIKTSNDKPTTLDKPYLEAFRANKERKHITSRRVPEMEE